MRTPAGLVRGAVALAGAVAVAVLGAAPVGARASDRAPDRALARAAILRPADVGPGWTPTPTDASNRFGPDNIPECRRVTAASHSGRTHHRLSPTFANGLASVASSASVYRSPRAADAAYGAITGADATSCLRSMILEGSGSATVRASEGAHARAVTISTTTAPDLGDASTAYQVQASAADNGPTRTVAAVLVTVRVGRVDVAATFSGPTTPSPDIVERVLAPAVQRLAKAANR
jgi:hypothetical protein